MGIRFWTARRAAIREDEGSALMLAMIVMLVLSTLSLALLARTMATMKFMRTGQNFDAALAIADAGLSDAVYTIQKGTPTATWTRGPVAHGAGTYTYRAEYLSGAEFNVFSKGVLGKSQHAIQARVGRTAKYPFVFFSNSNLEVNGSTSNAFLNFYSYNSLGPVPSVPPAVGSNGTVVCNGGLTGFTTHYVTGQTDCPGPYLETKPYDLSITVPPANGRPCQEATSSANPIAEAGRWGPSTFNVSGVETGNGIDVSKIPLIPITTIDGQNGTPIICTTDVRLYGLIRVINGPLKLYVVNKAVDISNALINVADLSLNVSGRASDFQLFKTGNAAFNVDSGNSISTLSLSGVINAPESSITFNGGKWWTGSVIANQITVNGTPNLKIGYDLDLANYLSDKWTVSRYREVAPSAVGL
jgi:hypothetical protein